MKIVIKMSAPWCGPCQQLKPIFDDVIAELTGINVVEINVDDKPDVASAYKVRSVPTIIITDEHDNVLATKSGMMTKEQLIAFIESC